MTFWRTIAPVLLGGSIVGCIGEPPAVAADGASETPTTTAAPSEPEAPQRAEPAWEDPEPPGAQALAEEVLEAPWNADKITRLTMSITTLVDHTTGLVGFSTALEGGDVGVEERLSRLGAEVGEREIVIRLPGSILFDFDSDAIRPDAERALADVAGVLSAYADRLATVEGHTDSIASEGYNQALSERRAQAVVEWLVEHGVSNERLRATGAGESRPVADNATADGRQANRRVEVVIAGSDDP